MPYSVGLLVLVKKASLLISNAKRQAISDISRMRGVKRNDVYSSSETRVWEDVGRTPLWPRRTQVYSCFNLNSLDGCWESTVDNCFTNGCQAPHMSALQHCPWLQLGFGSLLTCCPSQGCKVFKYRFEGPNAFETKIINTEEAKIEIK